MKRVWLVLGGLGSLYLTAVNVSNYPPAVAYNGFWNQVWVALGLHNFSHPCVRQEETKYGTLMIGLPTDECFRMSPPKRMRGVWIDEFEGSQFFAGAKDATEVEVGWRTGTWLDLGTSQSTRHPDFRPIDRPKAFDIDFVGRETLFSGKYGHLGGSKNFIVVDRLISAKPIDVAPYALKEEARLKKVVARSERQLH